MGAPKVHRPRGSAGAALEEVLSHEVYDTVRANGGITIDLAGRRPDEGFAYAPYKTTEFKVAEAEFSPRHVEEYIDKHHKELVQPGNNLGMWVKDGYVYLDVSQVGPPTEATLAKAQAAHQLAVFDLDTFEEINLGTIDPTTKEFDPLGTPADLYRQYRGQVARADETVRARRSGPVSEGEGRSGTGSAATRLAPISDVTGEGEKLWPGTVKVARPTRRSDVNEMVGDHWGGLGYDELKDTIRLGVRKAQTQGYSGFKTESKDIDFKDERTRFELFGSDAGPEGPSEGMLLIEGKELAATAIHSKPTDAPLFRGMGIKAKDLKALTVGDELSFLHHLSVAALDWLKSLGEVTGIGGAQRTTPRTRNLLSFNWNRVQRLPILADSWAAVKMSPLAGSRSLT